MRKADAEIEQNVKRMKYMMVEEANKQTEPTYHRLKLDEVAILEQEMNKANKLTRDIPKIEELLMKLKAFKGLNSDLRELIILRADLRWFKRNEVIYQQGAEGHNYFYMIRGSVSMLSNREDFGNFDLYLRSYYDGSVFGEQPQLFAKQETQVASDEQLQKLAVRDATCIANDDCLVVEVQNTVKEEFYTNDSSNQYERCLYWLRKNAIFRSTEGFYLLQMIFNIEKRVYSLGDALVRAGDKPDGMFIITSGQCKAVLEGVGVKQVETGDFSRF